MHAPLRSPVFDDVYFCAESGLEETRHVFLKGNGLPEMWEGATHFTIFETGFGTGLNFLAVWALFEGTAAPGKSLDFISFEKYPLDPKTIQRALGHWAGDLGAARLELLLNAKGRDFDAPRPDGGTVRLRVIEGDINDTLPLFQAERPADVWFLDGFSPAKNPQMWTPHLYENMARLSRPGTRVATFTVAGAVREGLTQAGFRVEKAPGFGRKRHMTRGVFEGQA